MMPRVTKPLTNTEVDKAKTKDKEYNLSDGNGLFYALSLPVLRLGFSIIITQ